MEKEATLVEDLGGVTLSDFRSGFPCSSILCVPDSSRQGSENGDSVLSSRRNSSAHWRRQKRTQRPTGSQYRPTADRGTRAATCLREILYKKPGDADLPVACGFANANLCMGKTQSRIEVPIQTRSQQSRAEARSVPFYFPAKSIPPARRQSVPCEQTKTACQAKPKAHPIDSCKGLDFTARES